MALADRSRDTSLDTEVAARGVESLGRIAAALERIADVMDDELIAPRVRVLSTDETWRPGGVERGRAVTPGTEEPSSAPLCPPPTLAVQLGDASAVRPFTGRARPWLGDVAVALAATSAILAGDTWLLAPLAACAWWWMSPAWRWSWLLPFGRAWITVAWVALGAGLVGPGLPLVGAVVWASMPAVLAGVEALLGFRRRHRDSVPMPGLFGKRPSS